MFAWSPLTTYSDNLLWPSDITDSNFVIQSPDAIWTALHPRYGQGRCCWELESHLVLLLFTPVPATKTSSQQSQPSAQRPRTSQEKHKSCVSATAAHHESLVSALSMASTLARISDSEKFMPLRNLCLLQNRLSKNSSFKSSLVNTSMASHLNDFREWDHSEKWFTNAGSQQVCWNLSRIVGQRSNFSTARNPSKVFSHLVQV